MNGRVSIVKRLLKVNLIDADSVNSDGMTALSLAAMHCGDGDCAAGVFAGYPAAEDGDF